MCCVCFALCVLRVCVRMQECVCVCCVCGAKECVYNFLECIYVIFHLPQ